MVASVGPGLHWLRYDASRRVLREGGSLTVEISQKFVREIAVGTRRSE
jgi:hypothetical protein